MALLELLIAPLVRLLARSERRNASARRLWALPGLLRALAVRSLARPRASTAVAELLLPLAEALLAPIEPLLAVIDVLLAPIELLLARR